MSQIKTMDLCERCELNNVEHEGDCLLIKDNTPCPHFTTIAEENIPEMIDHPKHYGRDGAMECIEEMILVFGVEATMNFCLLNAWKYRYRAADKGGNEDLKKSDWYMNLYRDLSNGVITDG